MSHALRVRGLKPCPACGEHANIWSHALRVRGLKHFCCVRQRQILSVARSTRAWIETPLSLFGLVKSSRRTLYACVD